MSAYAVHSGFPDDLPAELVAEVDALAARDARGEPVPSLLASYTGADGRPKTLLWRPTAEHRRALARFGLDADDGGSGAA